MRKKYFVTAVCLLILFILLNCQRISVPEKRFHNEGAIWMWGGDCQRRGWSSETLAPPLEKIWRFKANAALGKAITAKGDKLYFGLKKGEITILKIGTGEKVRTMEILRKKEVTCVMDENRLIVIRRNGDKSLRAIDINSGKTVWKQETGFITGEPVVSDHRLYGCNENQEVFCVDALSGELLWKKKQNVPLNGGLAMLKPWLLIAGDRGDVMCLNQLDGGIRWKRNLPGPIAASPVLSKGKCLIGTLEGHFYALSIKDGSVLWKFSAHGNIFETAAANHASVFFGTTRGVLYRLSLNNGDETWKFETGSVIGTSPVLTGDWIYFGALNKTIYGVNANTGREEWRFLAKGRVRTSPLIWEGRLFIASEDRYVYAFAEKTGNREEK